MYTGLLLRDAGRIVLAPGLLRDSTPSLGSHSPSLSSHSPSIGCHLIPELDAGGAELENEAVKPAHRPWLQHTTLKEAEMSTVIRHHKQCIRIVL